MFERFTEKAIKVIMLAQEEARRLGHNFVGTEQILLGLIGEGTGVAAKVPLLPRRQGRLDSVARDANRHETELNQFSTLPVGIPALIEQKPALHFCID